MVMTYQSAGDRDPDKPKHSVHKILKKFVTVAGVHLTGNTPIYYSWKQEQPEWVQNKQTLRWEPLKGYFTVDYDRKKREWYLGYIKSIDDRRFCTVDDLTGECSLTT